NAIFVADLDMVGSMFFEIRRRGFGGSKIEFDNVTFILNCVDELAGDRSFIEVRKRRPKHRTLTTIAARQQVYNQEWLAEKALAEDKAGEELAAAQKRLDDRIAEVRENLELDERSKKIQIETIREIEQRRLDLAKARIEDEKQRAIDLAKASKLQQQNSIQAWYTTVTLAGTPIPALLVAFWIFLRRRRREREIVPGSRYTGGAS
ncbi:MAG: ABC transporter, partial [Planctomycetota bacterium]|nr:ABC transporter [Planctomycetota bacterium]